MAILLTCLGLSPAIDAVPPD